MIFRILACSLMVAMITPSATHAFSTTHQDERLGTPQTQLKATENLEAGSEYQILSIESLCAIDLNTKCTSMTERKTQRDPIPSQVADIQHPLFGSCFSDRTPNVLVGSPEQAGSARCEKRNGDYVLFPSPISGHAPLTVTFTANGLQSSQSYRIDYGDGSASEPLHAVNVCMAPVGANPAGCPTIIVSHTYNATGTHRAVLTTVPKCLPTSPGRAPSCKRLVLAEARINVR
jgi:hypothetical protein